LLPRFLDRDEWRKLLVGAESHHAFDSCPVVPTAIKDHDLAGGGKVLKESRL
jgi:hypothetical protein